MQDFFCETQTISEVKGIIGRIQEILANTYTNAQMVRISVEDGENVWEGLSQQTGIAFLDLTMQYHAKLSENPVQQAFQALDNYLKTDEVFYDNWEDYQELSSI